MITVMNRAVRIDYTNYRGERRWRTILPLELVFGTFPHHEGAQWFLHAVDEERGLKRTFAMKDVHAWEPTGG
jgi:predicted DNA-binding transcriptional regulator YafY